MKNTGIRHSRIPVSNHSRVRNPVLWTNGGLITALHIHEHYSSVVSPSSFSMDSGSATFSSSSSWRSRWKVSLLRNKNPAPLPAYRVRLHMFLRDYISVIFHASALSLRSVDRCRDRSPVLPLQFPSSRNAKRNLDLHWLSSHLFSRFSHHLCCSWAALTVFKTCFRQPYPIYKAYLEL